VHPDVLRNKQQDERHEHWPVEASSAFKLKSSLSKPGGTHGGFCRFPFVFAALMLKHCLCQVCQVVREILIALTRTKAALCGTDC
jgi:hypothetical protein